MEGETNPTKLYMSGDTVLVSTDGGESVFPTISQDLLQQALQEVTQPGELQQVKEEPGVYARMDTLLPAHTVAGLEQVAHVAAPPKEEQNPINKVKIENGDQCSLIIEGDSNNSVTLTAQEAEALGLTNSSRSFATQPSFSGPVTQSQFPVRSERLVKPPAMVLIPTLQSDGTVAYTVQQTDFSAGLSLQPGDIKAAENPTTTVNVSSSAVLQSSPTRSLTQNKVSILRQSNKQKVILPKTFQQAPHHFLPPNQPHMTPIQKLVTNSQNAPFGQIQSQAQINSIRRVIPTSTPSGLYKQNNPGTNHIVTNVGSPSRPTFLSPSISRAPSVLLKTNGGQSSQKSLFTSADTKQTSTISSTDPSMVNVRRLQLITGADGHSRPIEVICSGGEANVRSDQPLTQLEMQHIQSILQHQKQEGSETGNQVYRVMYPKQVKHLQEQVKTLASVQGVELRKQEQLEDSEKMVKIVNA